MKINQKPAPSDVGFNFNGRQSDLFMPFMNVKNKNGKVHVSRSFPGESMFVCPGPNTHIDYATDTIIKKASDGSGVTRVSSRNGGYYNAINVPTCNAGPICSGGPIFPQQPSGTGPSSQSPSGGAGTGSGTTSTGGSGTTTPGGSGSQSPSGGAGTGSGTTSTGGGSTSQNPGGGAGTGTGTTTGGANTLPSGNAQNPGNVINPNADPKNLTPTGNTLPYQQTPTVVTPMPYYGGGIGGGGGGYAGDYGAAEPVQNSKLLTYVGIGLIVAIGAYFITKPASAA